MCIDQLTILLRDTVEHQTTRGPRFEPSAKTTQSYVFNLFSFRTSSSIPSAASLHSNYNGIHDFQVVRQIKGAKLTVLLNRVHKRVFV